MVNLLNYNIKKLYLLGKRRNLPVTNGNDCIKKRKYLKYYAAHVHDNKSGNIFFLASSRKPRLTAN